MVYLFRQADYKCEDFLIFLPGGSYFAFTDQWVSKLHCLSALQRSYRAPGAQTSLPSPASKLGSSFSNNQVWACVPGTEGKQPKSGTLQSTIYSNATAVAMPPQAPALPQEEPCQAWCGVQDRAACLLPGVLCSAGEFEGEWELGSERPQQKKTGSQSQKLHCMNRDGLYRLSLLKSSACKSGYGGSSHDISFSCCLSAALCFHLTERGTTAFEAV